MTKWFRKYKNGYLVAVFISSILFHFADGTLVAYQQLKTPPQEVYQVVFEDVTEYESLWLKTILYENEDTRMLHVELKESKLKNVIKSSINIDKMRNFADRKRTVDKFGCLQPPKKMLKPHFPAYFPCSYCFYYHLSHRKGSPSTGN